MASTWRDHHRGEALAAARAAAPAIASARARELEGGGCVWAHRRRHGRRLPGSEVRRRPRATST